MNAERRTPGALELAGRLWPPPDPANFAKREAVAHLLRLDRPLRAAVRLRAGVDDLAFPDLSRLWIFPTRLEALVALLAKELETATREAREVVDVLREARIENEIRNCAERLLERRERRAEPECG